MSSRIFQLSSLLVALVMSSLALAVVQEEATHNIKPEILLFITAVVVGYAVDRFGVMSSFEGASRGKNAFALLILVAPYLGGILIERNYFGFTTFKSLGDIFVVVMVYLVCSIACIVAMFFVWILIQGGRPESFTVTELHVPSLFGKSTNYQITHEKEIQGRETSFDGLMHFNLGMGMGMFFLFCLLGLCFAIWAFVTK